MNKKEKKKVSAKATLRKIRKSEQLSFPKKREEEEKKK